MPVSFVVSSDGGMIESNQVQRFANKCNTRTLKVAKFRTMGDSIDTKIIKFKYEGLDTL